MGKKSTPSGNISINGQTKASSYTKGGSTYTNYNMSDAEQKIFDYAQNSFLSSLPNVNVFSEETQKGFRNQLNAYEKQGLEGIDKMYTPIINNLKSDITSRFGNFDNSSFLNKLSDIEDNRSQAMSSLSQDLITKQNNLVNDELSRRYNYLSLLDGIQNQTYSNILNYSNAAANRSGSSSGGNSLNLGDFSQTVYSALQMLKYMK